MTEPTLFEMSYEELIYLLASKKEPLLPGLDDTFMRTLSQDQRDLVFAVVDRALRARGMLAAVSPTERFIAPDVLGVLQTAAHPTHVIIVRSIQQGRSQTVYCSVTPKFFVERSEIEPGIHHFAVVSGRNDALDLLVNYLNLGKGETIGAPVALPANTWHTIHATITTAPQHALPAIQNTVASPLADAFYQALTSSLVRYEFQQAAPDLTEVTSLCTIVQSEHDMFLITENAPLGQLVPSNAHSVIAWLRQQLAAIVNMQGITA